MLVSLDGEPFGRADAGVDMTFDFGVLIAHAAKTRDLSAGSIIGSGTVSNRGKDGGPGKPVRDGGDGYSCIAEVRTVEKILEGAPKTPFLVPGNRVRIEMTDDAGASIFGAIDQVVGAAR
jgi:fumarylacetoacetate (FAA) hydrolase